ncbi:MAG TPA: SRPBCC family protein [Actinomycetota bacterium]|nr:SRPBCC family protein [Actinomycetota bacterium]
MKRWRITGVCPLGDQVRRVTGSREAPDSSQNTIAARRLRALARILGPVLGHPAGIETVIRRPAEDVFDFCSDLRSELRWNPKAKYVEKLTEGPVGVGTRYRAQWVNSGPTVVEVVQFDRPWSWETHTNARGMGIRFQGTITDAAPGARYTAYLELRPRRLARLVAALALVAMRRQDQRNMQRIREALESPTVTLD